MEGVLEGACVLGMCKLACSLFFLPDFSGLISFCCCCLLMFTDLLVTGFLLFLWLADPWPARLSPHSDLVALRFLLFLGHTYAAVLLLTAPLVAAETALREVWPRGCEGRKALECGVALETGDARPPGAEADRGRDKWRRLSRAIGYLCCLSVWMVSGLWVECRGRSLEELWVTECLHASDSLVACLPRMFPSPVGPFWGVALLGLLLLLFLAMELAARVRREKRNAGVGAANNNNNNHQSNRWQHFVPALVRPSSPMTEPWPVVEPEPRSVDPEKTSSSCPAPTADPWTSRQQMAHHPEPVPPAPESTPGDPRRGPDRAGWEIGRGLGPERCHRGPRRVVPRLGVIITTALAGVLSLCTLPLTLSVNVLLVQTIQAVVEGCVETCLARRRPGEAKTTVLKT